MMGGKWYYTSPVCSIKNICVTLRGRIKETARTRLAHAQCFNWV